MKRAGGPGSNEKPPAGFSTSSNHLRKGLRQKMLKIPARAAMIKTKCTL